MDENPYRSFDAASSWETRPRSPEERAARGRIVFLAVAVALAAMEIGLPLATGNELVPLRIVTFGGLLFAAWRGHVEVCRHCGRYVDVPA